MDKQKLLEELYPKIKIDDGLGFFRGLKNILILEIGVLLLAAIIGLVFVKFAHAENINMQKIMHIESAGNPTAVSRAGAIGLYQIMPVVLQEYNQFHGQKYTRKNLYNPEINTKIANWYINFRIPQLLQHYKKPDTVENRLKCYNAGIRSVVQNYTPAETKKYIAKYRRSELGR